MNWEYFILAIIVIAVIAELGDKWLKHRRRSPYARYVHVKTKGVYEVLEVGRLESNCARMVVYRSLETLDVWVRDYNEFFDGRFVAQPTIQNERK